MMSNHDKPEVIADKIKKGIYTLADNASLRSVVWKVVARVIDENGETLQSYAYCKLCHKVLRYNKKQSSNMGRHPCVAEYRLSQKDNEDFEDYDELTQTKDFQMFAKNKRINSYDSNEARVKTEHVSDEEHLVDVSNNQLAALLDESSKESSTVAGVKRHSLDKPNNAADSKRLRLEASHAQQHDVLLAMQHENPLSPTQDVIEETQNMLAESLDPLTVSSEHSSQPTDDAKAVVALDKAKSCHNCSNNEPRTSRLVNIEISKHNTQNYWKSHEHVQNAKSELYDFMLRLTIENCLPLRLMQHDEFLKIANFFTQMGAKYGKHLNLAASMPTICNLQCTIEKSYELCLSELQSELKHVVKKGYALSTGLWNDGSMRVFYILVLIHYGVQQHEVTTKLLGIVPFKYENLTAHNIKIKIAALLANFGLVEQHKIFNVIINNDKLQAAFDNQKTIICINDLLQCALEECLQQFGEIAQMFESCQQAYSLAQKKQQCYDFAKDHFQNMLAFAAVEYIASNRKQIEEIIREHKSLNIYIDFELLSKIVEVLQYFKQIFSTLAMETRATLHFAYMHIHRLRKLLSLPAAKMNESDDVVNQFRAKLCTLLDEQVIGNLSIWHKIALYLFPPANKLIAFSKEQQAHTKEETIKLMQLFASNEEPEEQESTQTLHKTLSSVNMELLGDFVEQQELSLQEKINLEIQMYESTKVKFHDDFNLYRWWQQHHTNFPLLYRVSSHLLAAPASLVSGERMFGEIQRLLAQTQLQEFSALNVCEIVFLYCNNKDCKRNS